MNLASHSLCSGCTACYAVCPRKAISMTPDVEGFTHPCVDESLCNHCGLCERVCPVLHPKESRTPLAVYAAKAKDESLRMDSSSGGVFSVLALNVLKNGGLVFGAAFDHSDWHVYHRSIDNEVDLSELRGSKYVQSEMGDEFRAVKDGLEAGRDVLFSGTPCQIAGLKSYLLSSKRVMMDKLLLVEVVCHAVPSPLAWKKYLGKRIASMCGGKMGGLGDIRRISFRRKNCGWKRYAMSLEISSGMAYLACFDKDPFLKGFLFDLYNRLSCHNCQTRDLRSGADLTIADYWNVHQRFPEIDDDKGVSLVLVNTEKGSRMVSAVSSSVDMYLSDFDHACKTNPAIVYSKLSHNNRASFFKKVNTVDFDKLVETLTRKCLLTRFNLFCRRCMQKIGLTA